jgi:hypothetical protein
MGEFLALVRVKTSIQKEMEKIEESIKALEAEEKKLA